METDYKNLPLREYRPQPMLRVASHEVASAATAVVDAHNHLGQGSPSRARGIGENWLVPDVGALIALMDECNIRSIINLDGRWGAELEANVNRYDRAHPGRFATFCRLKLDECQQPGWPARLVKVLRESAEHGAAGIKVLKDLGLRIRDEKEQLLICDDDRLAPIWDTAAELHLPVLIHVADPAAFFEPLTAHNERLEQLLARPEWQVADPNFPRLGFLLEALENLISSHPNVTFIGAHVGCYAEDLFWVSRMLESYPNFYIDIAGRTAELGRQPRATRRLVLRHQTRVLFGTDRFPPTRETYSIYFRFLETDDEHFPYGETDPPDSGRWAISGIHLPAEVLRDIYTDNAQRIIPALSFN
jgi:predicted TIM-barrel fold metal-dependent hydrolase